MSRYILLFFGLMATSLVYAQDKISVTGKITDRVTREPIPFVHIINKGKGQGVASNVDGTFKIMIEPGDSLLFSAVGYSKHALVIKEQMQEVYIDIKLDAETMELDAVNVFAYRDLASLKKAVIEMDVPLEEEKKLDLNLPAPSVYPEGGGITFSGGITSLINGIGLNKKYNEVQKYNELKSEQEKQSIISQKYNVHIVQRWTDLKEEELKSFMEFCKLSDDFIFRASEYDLAVVVHQCLDEYKEKSGNK